MQVRNIELDDHFSLLTSMYNKGIEYISARQEYKHSFNLTVTSKDNINLQQNIDHGTGFQIQHGSRKVFYSSNFPTNTLSDMTNLVDRIILKEGKKNTRDNYQPIKRDLDILNDGVWIDSYLDQLYELSSIIRDILNEYKSTISYSVDIYGEFLSKLFQSTMNHQISQKFSLGIVSITLLNKQNTISRTQNIGGIEKENLNVDYIIEVVNNMVDEIQRIERYQKVVKGKHKVLLSPDTAFSLAHESIAHGCEADQIINRNSFLTGRIGQKVASSIVTIVDDPHLRSTGWLEYDDEGTKSTGTLLVDDGILVDYLHTKETAEKLGTFSTGNARADSYLTPVKPRQTNLFIEPKNHTFEELIEEVYNGYYIGPTFSASTSIYTGEYNIISQFAYQIDRGEIKEITGPLILSGNSLNSLSKITAIGRDVEYFPARCLKMNSNIHIGAISPAFVIDEMQIN
ncbi:MAG: TldD/PmbA family protein [Candidatus Heimdallarchaeota archaeon]|nr:TldD/PmbA family protein [Candidatus Heimdallarchaeota archaeon]